MTTAPDVAMSPTSRHAAAPIAVGDLAHLPARLGSHAPDIVAEPGRVVSVDDGWAMVDRGDWGEFGVPVGDLRRVCPGESYPPPNWHLDYIDYPTGWFLARQGLLHTDRRCSYVATWGGLLCDCGAVEAEWARRKERMS